MNQPNPDPAFQPPAPPDPPSQAPRHRRPVLAWTVAALAVVVALSAGGFALYALGKAAGARQTATAGKPPAPAAANTAVAATSEAPTTGAGTGPSPVGSAAPGVDTTPGQLDPKAKFIEAYQQQQLTLRPASCNSVYIDLDEPRVGVPSPIADLTFSGARCSSGQATFVLQNDGSTASLAGSPSATPSDCAQAIRTGPISYQSPVPITEHLVLCVATSVSEAINQGKPQKIAVVQVRSIAQDGTVDIIVSAWNVPR